MSKYKKGQKFIIEIKEVIESNKGTLYRTNFSTLVFDDYGLDSLEQIKPKFEVGEEVKIKCEYDEEYYTGVIVEVCDKLVTVLTNKDGKYKITNDYIFVRNENIIEKTGKKISLELK